MIEYGGLQTVAEEEEEEEEETWTDILLGMDGSSKMV